MTGRTLALHVYDAASLVFIGGLTVWAIVPDLPGCSDASAWCGLSGIVRGDFLFVSGGLFGWWAVLRKFVVAPLLVRKASETRGNP